MNDKATIKLPKNVWLLFVSLYITEYVGTGFLTIALALILRKDGMELNQLSLIPLMMLPIGLKILWAPIVDKYLKGRLSHYRNWLIISLSFMLICLMNIAFLDPIKQFYIILPIIFIFSIMTATQELAISGLACNIFLAEQRYLISSIKTSGSMIGNILGGGVILLLYAYIGWMWCLLLITVLVGFTLIQLFFFEEYRYSQNQPIAESNDPQYWKNLITIWKGKINWLIILILMPFSFLPAYNLLSPILVDDGWALPDIAILLKVFGSIVSLVAVVLISIILKRLTRKQSLVYSLLCHAFCLLSFIPISLGYVNVFSVYLACFLYFFSLPLMSIAITAIIMDNSDSSQARSTAWNAQLAPSYFCGFAVISLSYYLAQNFGYFPVVIGSIALAFFNGVYASKVIKN